MTIQTVAAVRYPVSDRGQRMQDLVLVSAFGMWATLLGLSPLLAVRSWKILWASVIVN